MRGCMKNLTKSLNGYTRDTLDFVVQPIDKLPKCQDKLSFLTTVKFILSQMENDKKRICEQIFLLTKLYETSINRDKISFDKNVQEFARLVSSGTVQYSKVLKALFNEQVTSLLDNIDFYAKCEISVRRNINLHLKNCAKCYALLNSGIQKFSINNKNLNNLTNNMPEYEDFNEFCLPNFYYCKKDLLTKIKYINNFSSDFIKIDKSKLYDFNKTLNKNIKGDYTL